MGRVEDCRALGRSTLEGGNAANASGIEIETIRDTSMLLALREEWGSVVTAADVTVFQTFDWQWLWWKYFGRKLQLNILLFRRGRRLIGIAPVYVDVHSVFGVPLYRQLRFMGGGVRDLRSQWSLAEFGPSDYLDIVALPEYEEEVGDRFLSYLREERWFDEANLENIPEDGFSMKVVVPQLSLRGYSFSLLQDHVCPRITVPASLEEYLRGLRSSVRHRLSQARRAYTSEGFYSVRSVQSGEEMGKALDELVRLHQLRWNRLGYPGMFADYRFEGFLREVAGRFLEKGWLWFKTARANGNCIAARLGFKFKDSLNDFIAGFDQESPAARRRPGLALLLSMVEDAICSRMRKLNFVRGYETYKGEVASEISHNWKLVVPNPHARQSVRLRWYRITDRMLFLVRRVYFEWTMFRVHYREHGILAFVIRYVAFRTKKLFEKIAVILNSTL
jgi:CelD/BcsL family acetyltransferase involved in cellulose biosynthesis